MRIGVPHSPHYPSKIAKDGPEDTARLYREVAATLDAAKPDAIVIFANDHFNTFFLNNFPTFAIGVAERGCGPNDQTVMPSYDFPVHEALAAHIRDVGVRAGFDFSVVGEVGVDHAMPLHYLTDGENSGGAGLGQRFRVKPLPTAHRCYALGTMIPQGSRSGAAASPRRLGQFS